ncbi:uncharacterized protein LOC125739989 [Brienomyrus brachyistius]|uniref:uncharacterized protein LOC125739989 n=1 Tax=Brienomyrus brachyistius TaxID=42636 RepID=UPI0020B3473E|nr:uncharacterized protein LOC125739989 [Brienomyrus brachyistius]
MRALRMMFRLLLILCLGHCLPADLGVEYGIDSHVGDTVTLPCDGPAATDTKEVHVMWMFEGKPVCWFEDAHWCETGHYVNRTRLGSVRQNNFSLVINHVKEEDDGVYECRITGGKNMMSRLFVDGDRKRRDAEMATKDPVCRPYREMEDPPGSENKDKRDSDENLSGASLGGNSVVIGVIVGMVVLLGAVAVAAVFTKRLWNRQRNKPSKRRPSEANLI